MKKYRIAILCLVSSVTFGVFAALTPSPEGAKVYIVSPKDGAELKSPVKVIFGLSGMGVAPAGMAAANTGHHHLMVDVKELPNMKMPFPKNENHIHFGGGQTETVLNLAPGKHTLQLVLADQAHFPHDPAVVSEKITITVRK